MINWTLQTIPIKSLKNHPKNPRQITKDQYHHLEGLIKKFGLIDKPIFNTDFTIIGGHQRVRILKKMKAKTVECWVPDHLLSEEEIDHLCVGLNLNQGSFDYDLIHSHFDEISLLNWGFTEAQLTGCIDDLDEDEGEPEGSKRKKKKSTCPSCGCEF
jgi:site-specific DNA-methyltransferase (adenine-specific)